MSLSTDDVRHVARLARLALSEEEVEALGPQLESILAYARKVGEVAADDVPPTSHPYPLRNVYRPDQPHPSLSATDAISTAPRAEGGRFHVPRIVEDQA